MRFSVLVSLLLLVVLPASAQNVVIPDSAADAAATSWLALVDSAQYAQSWEEAAPAFKAQVSSSQWVQAASQARGPLGALQQRTLRAVQMMAELPGMPRGNYMAMEYASRFAQMPRAIETHVLIQGVDEMWRTGGYFVRPAP